MIDQLAYLVVEATDIEKWRSFGTQILGMEARDGPDGELYFKIDERAFRILVLPGEHDRLLSSGWEVASEEAFNAFRIRLEQAGIAIASPDEAVRTQRHVSGLFQLSDPAGNVIEVCWGPISDFARFVSPVGVRSFVTGEMGMGHIVLPALNFDESCAFWTAHMGMDLSDILRLPGLPGPSGAPARVHFFHCNPRQHSLALGEVQDPSGCFHFMLEVPDIDEVGLALDRANEQQAPLASTLGRHVNDDMVSFYIWTPGGFQVEFGCGGMVKDWAADNIVFETTRGSRWGHQWLPRLEA